LGGGKVNPKTKKKEEAGQEGGLLPKLCPRGGGDPKKRN